MTRLFVLFLFFLFAGCGVEVAGTAAVGARTQIDAVRQAEEIKANVQNQLDAAAQSEKQKLERAESAARP